MKPLFFTQHARNVIDERAFDTAWIERTVRDPEWVLPTRIAQASNAGSARFRSSETASCGWPAMKPRSKSVY
jgi:hypothetical protein